MPKRVFSCARCGTLSNMNSNYDSWKTTDPTDCPSVEDECPRDCEGCPTCQPEETCPDTERAPQNGT
jgi:hypothetical protein